MRLSIDATYDMYEETVDPGYGVQKIINDENTRINAKESIINLEYDTKTRKEMFIRSETARRNATNKIYLVLAVVSILSLSVLYLNRVMPFIPETLVYLLVIITMAVGIIYTIILYVDMQKRDRLDYTKVDFASLINPKITKPKVTGTAIKTEESPDCEGDHCCIDNSVFVDNKCRKIEGFAGSVNPFSPQPSYISTL